MEKKVPIPEDMMPCLSNYFISKEFEDDLNVLFDEVQQIEHINKQGKESTTEAQPVYSIQSVIKFFQNAIEDTDECQEILKKISEEQIGKSVKAELENARKAAGTTNAKVDEMSKREVVEVFKRMIQREFDNINQEYYSKAPTPLAGNIMTKPLEEEKKAPLFNPVLSAESGGSVKEEEKKSEGSVAPVKTSPREEEKGSLVKTPPREEEKGSLVKTLPREEEKGSLVKTVEPQSSTIECTTETLVKSALIEHGKEESNINKQDSKMQEKTAIQEETPKTKPVEEEKKNIVEEIKPQVTTMPEKKQQVEEEKKPVVEEEKKPSVIEETKKLVNIEEKKPVVEETKSPVVIETNSPVFEETKSQVVVEEKKTMIQEEKKENNVDLPQKNPSPVQEQKLPIEEVKKTDTSLPIPSAVMENLTEKQDKPPVQSSGPVKEMSKSEEATVIPKEAEKPKQEIPKQNIPDPVTEIKKQESPPEKTEQITVAEQKKEEESIDSAPTGQTNP